MIINNKHVYNEIARFNFDRYDPEDSIFRNENNMFCAEYKAMNGFPPA
jgi:hypothetical protein